MTAPDKIDSNATGLAFAEELALKTLPPIPIWYGLEPNSYSDFGGELTTVARSPLDPSRQRKKGTITGLDASGGFNSDFTKTNLTRILQGFFFADAREKISSKPLNDDKVTLTSIATNSFVAASGLDSFVVGSIILAANMGEFLNNGIAVVTAVTATNVEVSKTLIDDGTLPDAAFIETCGTEFAEGNLSLIASVNSIVLRTTTTDFTTFGLNIGEWIFLGGDDLINQFDETSPGYARIKSISATQLDFDDTTFVATTDMGASKKIRMFYGTVIRNEKDPGKIIRRSYNLERQLGNDGDGIQSEYLVGAVANEFTLNIPQEDKLNADLSFIALDNQQRTGAKGLKSGDRISAPSESAYNTSSDIYRMKLSVLDPATLNPSALFGYVTEATIIINNNVTPNKAIGTLGAFEATAGDFEISGSLTAYFSTVAAVQAVRNNANVALSVISASVNSAFIFDIPLLSLGGGRVNVEKDAAITVPVDTSGAECPAGYTMLSSFLPYVPDVGLPD